MHPEPVAGATKGGPCVSSCRRGELCRKGAPEEWLCAEVQVWSPAPRGFAPCLGRPGASTSQGVGRTLWQAWKSFGGDRGTLPAARKSGTELFPRASSLGFPPPAYLFPPILWIFVGLHCRHSMLHSSHSLSLLWREVERKQLKIIVMIIKLYEIPGICPGSWSCTRWTQAPTQ